MPSRTERYENLGPETLIDLIGKTVYIGVYSTDDECEAEFVGPLRYITRGSTYLSFNGDGEYWVRFNPDAGYALVTWLDSTD